MDATRHATFSEEVLRHVDRLYWFALMLTREPPRAEDLVQQTMLLAFEHADQLREGGECRAWLFTIMRNVHRMAIRRRNGGLADATSSEVLLAAVEEELYPPPPTPYAIVARELTLERIEQAIAELPPTYREVLILADVEGLAYEEIARVLDCAVGTVRSRLFRARTRLRVRVAGDGAEAPPTRRAAR